MEITNSLGQVLITEDEFKTMLKNGDSLSMKPVVKLFTPDASATWLLSGIDPYNQDIAFGLCDL